MICLITSGCDEVTTLARTAELEKRLTKAK